MKASAPVWNPSWWLSTSDVDWSDEDEEVDEDDDEDQRT